MVIVKITCGCNKQDKPMVFDTIAAAVIHSNETGHKLHGQVVIQK